MGAFFASSTSISTSNELPQPFWKTKGLKGLRGPNDNNKFIVDDQSDFKDNPIKFRYNTENDDDWSWEWTAHSDQHEWYPVKTTHYTVAVDDINRYPYNKIIDKTSIIPLELHHIAKPFINNNMDDNKDDNKDDDTDDDDNKDDDDDYDNIPKQSNVYSSTSYVQCKLPQLYENIRKHLVDKDPIPPHMLHKHGLATNAYQQVSLTPLAHSKQLQCRFASKDLNASSGGGGIGSAFRKHPVLLFYEIEPTNDWDTVWMFHLMQDSSIMKVCVEFDVKLWKKFKKNKGWTVSKDKFDISGKSLLDVAKWGVVYERNNPDYNELSNNCRKFMLKLSHHLNIKWDGVMMSEEIWYPLTDVGTDNVSHISDFTVSQDD